MSTYKTYNRGEWNSSSSICLLGNNQIDSLNIAMIERRLDQELDVSGDSRSWEESKTNLNFWKFMHFFLYLIPVLAFVCVMIFYFENRINRSDDNILSNSLSFSNVSNLEIVSSTYNS